MKNRRDWIAVVVVAVLLAVGVVLAGTAAPGAAGKAGADGTSSPSPWPSPTPGVVLQVGHDGTFFKSYTLADLEALTPFPGYAGFRKSTGTVIGPEAVTGAKVADIVQDALSAPLTSTQSVAFIGSDGYTQSYSYDQLVNLNGFTLMYNGAHPADPVPLSSFTGPFAAVLIYSDPQQNIMDLANGEGPTRLVVADATNENAVMTGSDSVYSVVKLDVRDYVPKDWSLKVSGLKIKGKRLTRTISRNDFQSCVNCHRSSYKVSGHRWSGTPLYMVVGEVDGGKDMTYNAKLARKGYRIELISTTGKTRIVSSKITVYRANMVLANLLDGAVPGSSAFPLRLVGPKLKAAQELGRIKSIVLLPWPKKK